MEKQREPKESSRKRRGKRRNIPPPIPTMATAKVRRYEQLYIFQSAATTTVSGKALLNWCMVAATATTAYRPFAAYRMRKIELWSPLIMSTTSNTGTLPPGVSVEWYAPTSGWSNSLKVLAVQDGMTPAYLSTRPPKGSTQDMWLQSGSADADSTATIIAISGLIGTVVRVTFDAKLVDDETVYGAEAPSGATVGKLYYNYLDGRTLGVIQPYGVNIVP